jgi:hypothetical protein
MRRWVPIVALWPSLIAVSPAPAALPPHTFFHVQVKSLDEVLQSARYLAPIIQAEDLLKNAVTGLKRLGGKDLGEVFDLKKPLGAYATWRPNQDAPDTAIVYFAVRDPSDFNKWLGGLLREVREDKEICQGTVPGASVPFFWRFVDSHVFFSPDRTRLQGPSLGVPAEVPSSLARLVLSAEHIPARWKAHILHDWEKTGYLPGGGGALGERLIADSQQLDVRLDLDRGKELLALRGVLTARPGTILAEEARRWGAGPSRFHRLHAGSLLSVSARLPLGEALQDVGEEWANELERAVDPRQRLLLRRLSQALGPTLRSGTLDAGFAALRGPAKGAESLVGGVAGIAGRRLENVVRDTFKDLPADERDAVALHWNYTHAGTSRVHLLWTPPGAQGKKVPIYATFGPNEVLLSLSEAGMKDAVHRWAQPVAEDAPPIHVEAHLQALAQLVFAFKGLAGKRTWSPARPFDFQDQGDLFRSLDEWVASPEGQKVSARLSKFFPSPDDDQLRLRLSLHGGDDLRLRLEMPAQLLRLIPLFYYTGPHSETGLRSRKDGSGD